MSSPQALSDNALLAEIKKLRHREHATTLEILTHLNEIERRRLHLKLGYSSLFDYCTRHLNYSASAAGRRIQAARCIRRSPDIGKLLEEEKIALMTVSMIAPVVTDDNKREILDAVCGRTQREVEAVLSRYRPPVALRDRVLPVRVHAANHSQCGSGSSKHSSGSTGQTDSAMSHHSQCGSDFSNMPNHATEQKLFIQFLASEAFMQKYEQARSLLSQRLSETSFANVFEALMEEFLESHCPVRRESRREAKRSARRSSANARIQDHSRLKPKQSVSGKSQPTVQNKPFQGAGMAVREPSPAQELSRHIPVAGKAAGKSSPARKRSRHIPANMRDEVYARDRGRCTYIGTNGTRCGSTQALQIDHIVPFARGGQNNAANLRLLCAKHNRLAARELFGAPLMKQYYARE